MLNDGRADAIEKNEATKDITSKPNWWAVQGQDQAEGGWSEELVDENWWRRNYVFKSSNARGGTTAVITVLENFYI